MMAVGASSPPDAPREALLLLQLVSFTSPSLLAEAHDGRVCAAGFLVSEAAVTTLKPPVRQRAL